MVEKRSKGGGLHLGPLGGALGYHLHRAAATSFAAYSRSLAPGKTAPGEYAILELLKENPGISQSALSKAVSRDKSTLTTTLKNMEAQGFVLRVGSETDRRVNHLHLTPKGQARLTAVAAKAGAHDARLDAIVGPARRDAFIGVLKDIAEAMAASPKRGKD